MNRVDLMIDKYYFCCCHSEKRVFSICKNMRGGRAGYGAGSSFLMDFNLLSHLKLSSRL